MHQDLQYKILLGDIKTYGVDKGERTGTGARSLFGRSMRFDLTDGKIPLLTTKKVFFKGIVHELLWMLSGDTNIRYLKEHGVSIWDSWVKPGTEEYVLNDDDSKALIAGELPKIYQHQWRQWDDTRVVDYHEAEILKEKGFEVIAEISASQFVVQRKIDQIKNVIERLKTHPDCRRLIVSAWNVAEIEEMALAPCHTLFQFYTKPMTHTERGEWYRARTTEAEQMEKKVLPIGEIVRLSVEEQISEAQADDSVTELYDSLGVPSRKLSCQLYQRSADTPIGLPFNIVQYSLLTHLVAQAVNMVPDEFIWVGGDTHIYSNQHEGVNEHIDRPLIEGPHPKVKLNPNITNIFDFTFDDIEVVDYEPQAVIKYPSAAV